MSRRAARIAAVEILYGADVRGVAVGELLDERDDCDRFCRGLVDSVALRRDQIDRLIAAHARNWSTDRMSVVDRNVLRVGTAELLDADVPAPAVIDEAVEIAKHFSGAEAGRFVNGVLEAVRQELDGAGGSRRSSEGSSADGGSPAGADGANGAASGSDGAAGAAGS